MWPEVRTQVDFGLQQVGHKALRKVCRSHQTRCCRNFVLIAATSICFGASAGAVEQTCALKMGAIKTVTRVNSADSVTLDDGTEVKLAGTLAPHARDGNAAPGTWPAETSAVATLSSMLLGKTVEIAFGAARADRYGRHVAHLFVGKGENRIWVQGALLSSGNARASAVPGTSECLPELLAHERVARQRRLGLWQTGLYRPKSATRTALLMYLRSSFHVVAGRVVSVSHTKSDTYLNFGDNWRQDFTIHIPKAIKTANPSWAASLDDFKDKRVEVRGWIERRNGPMMSLSHPAEIEIVPDSSSLHYRVPRQSAQFQSGNRQGAILEMPGPEQPGPGQPSPGQPGPEQPGNVDTPRPKDVRPEPKAPGAVDL